MNKIIYMDYAAATPVSRKAAEAMRPYLSDRFYNPSALYLAAKAVKNDLTNARARIAGHLGARPSEIIFTAGGTEANNLAIHGIMKRHPGSNIIISAVEHESVIAPARLYDCKEAKVLPDGRIDIDALPDLIDDNTVLVSVMYANNEIGTIQPIRKIARLIADIREQRSSSGNTLPVYLHADACQAAGYLDLHISRLGADLMTLNGGKIYGPKQSGALFARAPIRPLPVIFGGGQEAGLRSGTENVPAIIGLAAALDETVLIRESEARRLTILRDEFIKTLLDRLPEVRFIGSAKYRMPNNVHITIPRTDNERLIMALDEAGVQAASGSACGASSDKPSHVLKAIGLSDSDARGSLRFTLGRQTDESQIRAVVDKLSGLVV